MSFGEFMAATEGLRESYGEKIDTSSGRSGMSPEDFSHLEHCMAPSVSIREDSGD